MRTINVFLRKGLILDRIRAYYSDPRVRTYNICILANGIGRCCVTCWDIYTVVGSLEAWCWIEPNFWWSLAGPYIQISHKICGLTDASWTLLFWDQWSSFWHPVSARTLIVYRDATLLTIHRQQRWFQKMTHLNDNSKMCFHVVTNLDQSRLQLRHSQSKYSETSLLSF